MKLRHQVTSNLAPDDAPGRIRTCGPLLRRQPLCPLSYGGLALSHTVSGPSGGRRP
jgi:hypothetical protein